MIHFFETEDKRDKVQGQRYRAMQTSTFLPFQVRSNSNLLDFFLVGTNRTPLGLTIDVVVDGTEFVHMHHGDNLLIPLDEGLYSIEVESAGTVIAWSEWLQAFDFTITENTNDPRRLPLPLQFDVENNGIAYVYFLQYTIPKFQFLVKAASTGVALLYLVENGVETWTQLPLTVTIDGDYVRYSCDGGEAETDSGVFTLKIIDGVNEYESIPFMPFGTGVAPIPFDPRVYGYLYNWYAVDDARGITATGWSVPTDANWTTLTNYVQAEITAGRLPNIGIGRILKSARTQVGVPPVGISTDVAPRWDYDNADYGTNNLNYNGFGGGYRDDILGSFTNIGIDGFYWSATDAGANARALNLLYDNTIAGWTLLAKDTGNSIKPFRLATATELLLADGSPCAQYIGNDGKRYRTVKIGTQVWVADNLAETKYRDGSDIVSDDNLEGYWTFNEASGDALDYSGNGNTGTLTGGVTRVVGKVGNGLEFDGIDGKFESAMIDLAVFSLCAWVTCEADVSVFRTIFLKGNSPILRNFWLCASQTSGNLTLFFSVGGVSKSFNTGIPINDNQERFICATYDNTNVKIYINGLEVLSTPQSGAPNTTVENLTIGYFTAALSRHWSGDIDEARIYSRALTQDEITDLNNLRAVYGGISNANWAAAITGKLCAFDDNQSNV